LSVVSNPDEHGVNYKSRKDCYVISSLILAEPFIPSLLQNIPGGDTILNSFITKAFVPVTEAFKNNDNEKAANALYGTAQQTDVNNLFASYSY